MKKANLQTIARDVRALTRSVATLAKPGKKAHLTVVPSGRPEAETGEKYAGIILGKNGAQDYHLFKRPGEMSNAPWNDAVAYAKAGNKGRTDIALPNRRELALLYANLQEEFKTDAPYWSSEEYAGTRDSAWSQWFDDGSQYGWHKDRKSRACLVRRVPI